jgi:hypothetical protein
MIRVFNEPLDLKVTGYLELISSALLSQHPNRLQSDDGNKFTEPSNLESTLVHFLNTFLREAYRMGMYQPIKLEKLEIAWRETGYDVTFHFLCEDGFLVKAGYREDEASGRMSQLVFSDKYNGVPIEALVLVEGVRNN